MWRAAALAVLLTALPAHEIRRAEPMAVVVGKGADLEDASFDEVRRLLLLQRNRWGDGTAVDLILRPSGSAEKDLLLGVVYRMTEVELKRHFLDLVQRGEIDRLPRVLRSDEAVSRYVSRVPAAVSVLRASAVPGGMRVLRIGGLAPGDEGYPLVLPDEGD